MIEFKEYTPLILPGESVEYQIIEFLYEHLEAFGDSKKDISKALNYALGKNDKLGGSVIIAKNQKRILGLALQNATGMEGYIPENILVYLAIHKQWRGQGVGSKLLEEVLLRVSGSIALHVDTNNNARKLYEKYGFQCKYIEMRLENN